MGILDPILNIARAIRDAASRPPAPALPPRVDGVAGRIRLYGDPGVRLAAVDERWRKTNIVEFHAASALPGIPPQFYFQTHKAVVPHLRRALERAARECPEYEIERAASFVYRHQRHDPRRPLSMHSWGLAIDIDAGDNAAHEFKPGEYPEPWSDAWVKRWPRGLPQSFVEAFEAEGWTWGGRWKGFCDPMHFEWQRRP